MEKEAVTLVIPVYNVATYLNGFFKALDRQSFSHFKCLFVYDASQDDTLQVLKAAILDHSSYSSTLLMKPFKEGVGKARDFAIESGLIDTKYCLFLDADDIPHPDLLEKLYQKAVATDADITLCGFNRVLGGTDHLISTDMVNNPDTIDDLSSSLVVPYLNPAPWNKLLKTSIIGDVMFIYRGGTGEDEMFFLKLLPKCHRLAFVNEPLYDYLIHAGSSATSTSKADYEMACTGYLATKKYYLEHGGNYLAFLPLLEADVFLHVAIGTTTRVALAYPKEKRYVIRQSRQYLEANFPTWKKNKYLSHRSSRRLGRKTLHVWRCKILYELHLFSWFVWAYKTYVKLFKRDIKW